MRQLAITILSTAVFVMSARVETQADPVAPVTATSPATAKVLVLPFNVAAGTSTPWAGKAVQQNLFTDLIHSAKARVEAPDLAPPADATAAVKAARDASATIVIFGDIQSVGNQMRITGQVLDVATGTPLGGLKSTGPVNDLFKMEDAIGTQAADALPTGLANPIQPAATAPAQIYNYTVYTQPAPATTQAPQYPEVSYPQYTNNTYTYVNDYPSGGDYYPYAYAGYPYYYNPGFFITTGGFTRFRTQPLGSIRFGGGFNRGGFGFGGGMGFRGGIGGSFGGRGGGRR